MVAAMKPFDQQTGPEDAAPAALVPGADPYIALLVERHYLQSSMSQVGRQNFAAHDGEWKEE